MSKVKSVGVFGRRNSGKSSIINTICGQDVAIVSDTPGTTTDPVKKRMEIFGVGPTTFVDTAGIDDEGILGSQRVARTKRIISQIDLALLIYTGNQFGHFEEELAGRFRQEEIPFIIIHNQSDIIEMDRGLADELSKRYSVPVESFSCVMIESEDQDRAVMRLTERMVKALNSSAIAEKGMFEGVVQSGDHVVLVCPIDSEAPEGRLILPQVNAIRDIMDRGGIPIVMEPHNLKSYLDTCGVKPVMVVTDSQAFDKVSAIVPESIPLTGFSVVLARTKGDFAEYLKGTPYISKLKDGDRVLIMESCNHHSTCDDIGRVKLPKLLQKVSGARLEWDVVPGLEKLPRNIHDYAMVIQCGGCMITKRQLHSRLRVAIEASIPVSNYGMALAYCMGIYERATAPFLNE